MGANNRFLFSKARIEKLPVPAEGRRYWHDTRQPGLVVCVTNTGTRTFYVLKRVGRKVIRYRLGRALSELPVEEARKQAAQYIGQVAEGRNLQAERVESRGEPTVAEMFAFWLDEYAKPRKKTWAEDERMYRKFIEPRWAGRRLSAISEQDCEKLHAEVGEASGPYQANRLLELVRAMFTRARKKMKWRGINPAETVEPFTEESRDRFLQRSELPRFFRAVEQEPPLTRDFFLMLLFTGARRADCQAMRWDQIEGDVWRIPKTKSGKPVSLALVPEALAILESRRAAAGNSEWVFPTRRGAKVGHITEPKRAWANLVKRAEISDLRMHDLRRSLASYAAETGASLPIIAKMLGHEAGSRATQVYARLSVGPAREAATRATAEIAAIVAAANGIDHQDESAKGGE